MIRKISLIIIIFNLLIHCGFTPIHTNKNNPNFSIKNITIQGDSKINSYLKAYLNKFQNNKYEKKFTININTKYNKKVLAKDKAAKILSYQLTVDTTFQIISNKKMIKTFTVSEKQNMDKISDNLEEQKNENIIKQNFSSAIYNSLISELTILNDN